MSSIDTDNRQVAISAAELQQLLAASPDIRILDVRTPAEFETIHIPASFNVPLDRLGEHLDGVAKLESQLVLVCQSGQRATKAREKLAAGGKTNVRVLNGGIQSWQTIGADTVQGKERWSLERQVRGAAGAIVLASILASTKWKPARFLAGGIGAGLAFSALSNTCAMGNLLARLPYNQGDTPDIGAVLSELDNN